MDPNQSQPSTPPGMPASPQMDNTAVMGILAYLGPLIIVSYLMANSNPFVKFHIKQGLVLVIIELVVYVVGMFTWMLWPLWQLINLGVLILAIIGIVNVVQKQEKELPLVGNFAKSFNI